MAASSPATNYIGVFWDIENCQIPRGKSPLLICKKIRDLKFFKGYKEIQFAVACDAARESAYILDDLSKAQVDIFHVNSSSKNAADKKLKVLMRRFVNLHGSNSRIVLISGDGDFTDDIFDIKTHKDVEILVVYPHKASDALKSFAHNTISFADLVSDVRANVETHLKVTNLPSSLEDEQDKLDSEDILSAHVHNLNGRVISFDTDNGTAILAFDNADSARRFREQYSNHLIGSRKMFVQNHQWRRGPSPQRRPRGQSLGRQAQAVQEQARSYSSNENLSHWPRPPLLPTPVSLFTPVIPSTSVPSLFDDVVVSTTEQNRQFSTFHNNPKIQKSFFQPISNRPGKEIQRVDDLSSQRIETFFANIRTQSATSTTSNETQYSEPKAAAREPIIPVRQSMAAVRQPMGVVRQPITPVRQPTAAVGEFTSSSRKARRLNIKNRKASEATKEFLDKSQIFYQILAAESLEEEINQCLYRSIGEFNVEKMLSSGLTTLKLKLKSYDEAILIRDKLEKMFSRRLDTTTGTRLVRFECIRFSDEKLVRVISILNKIVHDKLSCPAEKMYLELYNEQISPAEVKDIVLAYRRQSSVDPGDFSGTLPAKSVRQFCLDILERQGSMPLKEFQELIGYNTDSYSDLLNSVLMGQDTDICLVVCDQGEIVIPKTGRVLHRFLFEAHQVCSRYILQDDPWARSIPMDRFRTKLRTMFPDAQMLWNLPSLSASQLTFSDTNISLKPIFVLCCHILRVRGGSRLPLAVADIDEHVGGVTEFIEKNILCSDTASVFLRMEYFFYLYNDRFMIGVLEYDEDLFSDVYRVKQGGPLDLGWTTEDWEYTENLLDLAGLSLPDQHYTTPLKHHKQQPQHHSSPSQLQQHPPTALQQKQPPPDLIGDVVGAGCSHSSARGAINSPVRNTGSSNSSVRGSGSPEPAGDLNSSIDSSTGLQRILGSGGTRGARSLRQEQIFSQSQQRAPHQAQGVFKQELTFSPAKQEAFRLIQPKKEEMKLDDSWNMDLRKLSGLRIRDLDVFLEKEDSGNSDISDFELEGAEGNLLSSTTRSGEAVIVVPESCPSTPERSRASSSITRANPHHLADTSSTPLVYTWTTPKDEAVNETRRKGKNNEPPRRGTPKKGVSTETASRRKSNETSSRRTSKLAANFNFLPK